MQQTIFNQVGKDVQGSQNVEEVLEKSGLNFKVEKMPCFAELPNGQKQEILGWKSTIRTDTNEVLGMVHDKYEICQNKDAFDFVNYVGKDLTYRKAGMTYTGMQYIIAELPESETLGEQYKNYVVFRNSFNGLYTLQATICPMRIICENQFNHIFKTENHISIRHSKMLQDRMKQGQDILMGYKKSIEILDKRINKYATIKYSQKEFEKFVNELYPITEYTKDKIEERQEEKRQYLIKAYNEADNQNYKGTLLGAINATTYIESHKMTLQSARTTTNDRNFIMLLDDNKQATNQLLKQFNITI